MLDKFSMEGGEVYKIYSKFELFGLRSITNIKIILLIIINYKN
ncbi:hypothetical protein ES703_05352 [subsurface metagenome]